MKSPPEAQFQIAILAEPSDQIDTLSTVDAIEWLLCKRTSEYVFEFYRNHVIVASVNLEKARFELHNLLGIVIVGDIAALDVIKSTWNSSLPSSTIAFKRRPQFEPVAILGAALECMADNLILQRLHSGRAALDLANYRREFERLQRSFTRLEEHVGQQSLLGSTEIFEYPPDSTVVSKGSTQNQLNEVSAQTSRYLTQYVPVDSFGFSSFSVLISAKPEAVDEPLRITLKAIETGQIYGAWSISAVEVPIGWVELTLNYAIDESALSLVVVVEWAPRTDDWALALGPPHPYRALRAQTETGRYLAAPLALRVFSRLPGVRVQATTSAIRPVDAKFASAQFIPYEIYATVAQVVPRVDDDKPALVSYDPNIGCITVHPRKGGLITAGRLNLTVPRHAWRFSAQIHLAHEQASPTQFALLVRAPDERIWELERLGEMNDASLGFSGWKVLSPLEKKSISAVLDAPHEEQLSIYLVTRQDQDSSPDFGWARFTRFEFSILPASLINANEPDSLAWASPSSISSAEPDHRRRKRESRLLGMEPNAKSV